MSSNVLIAVHGIRTFAEWNTAFSDLIRSKTAYDYRYVSYWPFDAVDMFSPFPFWRRTQRKVLSTILSAKNANEISILAHSFGTYIVTDILRKYPELQIQHLILCGSVVSRDFPWSEVRSRIKGVVINDCGTRDIWPALAELLSGSYDATGVVGIGDPARDRFHNFGHSGFFAEQFTRTQWLPLFRGDDLEPSFYSGTARERKYPWYITLILRLASYRTKVVMGAAVAAAVFLILFVFWNRCLFSVCPVWMAVDRQVSYTQSRCDENGKRVYSDLIRDEISFNTFIKAYQARWYMKTDESGAAALDKGQPVYTPPEVHDEGSFGGALQPEDHSRDRPPYYGYDISVSWWRKARVQWDYRDRHDEPEGVAFIGRYPIHGLRYEVRLPSPVKISKCRECSTPIDGLEVEGADAAFNSAIRNQCRFYPRPDGLVLTCPTQVELPAEKQITFRFDVNGWNCGAADGPR